MEVYVVLVALIALASSAYVPSSTSDHQLHTIHKRAASDIIYHFFSRTNPSKTIDVTAGNSAILKRTGFNVKKDVLFIIHGWKGSNDSDFTNTIRQSILELEDINVFVVDWDYYAAEPYLSAKNSVVKVGQYVAAFIKELQTNFNLDLDKVKFVGWSLGAHVSGNAGAVLGGKVNRITGLDPAGPFFTVNNKNNRLDDSDAKFVQVIHTSSVLGFQNPCGHADYYPNGGARQPSCGLDAFGSCSHARVFLLYEEGLRSNMLVGTKCGSWRQYQNGACSGNDKSVMGGFVPDYSARGSYYLVTNGKSPFGRG